MFYNSFKKLTNKFWPVENHDVESQIQKDVNFIMEKLIAGVIDSTGQVDVRSVLESRKHAKSIK
jgi:hypothetical protein